jgi:signal transduction histidine kinase
VEEIVDQRPYDLLFHGQIVAPVPKIASPAHKSIVLEDDLDLVPAAEARSVALQYLERVKRTAAQDWAERNVGDVLLALLAVASALELAFTHAHVEHRDALAPLVFFWAPALLFRKRFPLAAPATSLIALGIAATIDPTGLNNLAAPFFAVLAAACIFGATEDRRVAYAGGAMCIALVAYVSYQFEQTSISDFGWTFMFFGAAWLIGYFLSTRTREREEMRERAERAEHDRELRALAAVTEERARISSELHDIIGHSVSVMTVQASAVRRLLRPEQEREREALLVVEETGRAALGEMRRLVTALREPEEAPALTPQPSLGHIGKLVAQTSEAGLPTELRIEGTASELPAGIDLAAYRLVQEGLTNALKHANATHAEVVVRYANGSVELVVRDDGEGDGDGETGGHGLAGMRERVSVCGGDLEAGPQPDGGYEVRAWLPVTVS